VAVNESINKNQNFTKDNSFSNNLNIQKMKNNKLYIITLFTLTIMITISVASCKKEVGTENVKTNIQEPLDDANKSILSCMGFATSNAMNLGDYAHLEDDILISKETLTELANAKENSADNALQTRQYVSGALVSMNKVNNIKVYIDGQITNNSSNKDWNKAIEQALTDWNNVPNCSVYFSLTTSISSSNLAILYRSSPLLPANWNNYSKQTTTGLACFPNNGNLGRFISILPVSSVTTLEGKKRLMRHEIGHTLGLRHPCIDESTSREYDGCSKIINGKNLIQGTRECDSISVMRQFNVGDDVSKNLIISANDTKAIQYLYPDTYNVPTKTGQTFTSIPFSSKKSINFILNAPTNPVYRVKIERYSISGTLQETYKFEGAGLANLFNFQCPTGTWNFKIFRENYGTYSVASSTYKLTI
jgi:predicted Zn-dependent protease